jgi:hypothetical protein
MLFASGGKITRHRRKKQSFGQVHPGKKRLRIWDSLIENWSLRICHLSSEDVPPPPRPVLAGKLNQWQMTDFRAGSCLCRSAL